MLYGDPPQCREDGCPSRPIWIVETFDDYPNLADEYTDYTCGRHLMAFLSEWAVRHGTRVVLTRT